MGLIGFQIDVVEISKIFFGCKHPVNRGASSDRCQKINLDIEAAHSGNSGAFARGQRAGSGPITWPRSRTAADTNRRRRRSGR